MVLKPGQDANRAQSAYKPDSVPSGEGGGHLSGTTVARRLVRPTRRSRETGRLPVLMQHLPSCLALLPVGFAWPGLSPDPPVVSYTTFSPLPDLGTQPKVGGLFLWHYPSGHPAWLLASTAPCGVRTFLRRPADARDRPANWAQLHYSTESPPCQDVTTQRALSGRQRGPAKSRAELSDLGFEALQHLVNLGVAAQRLLGKDEVAVYRDLKDAPAAGNQSKAFKA